MSVEPDLSNLSLALGEPTRMRMLVSLMEGRAHTAKELAYGCDIRPSTGTAHLAKLQRAGLVNVRRQGRNKYFQLASPSVARCLEALMTVAVPVQALPSTTPRPLRHARFCYDHLAGRLGTALAAAATKKGWLRSRQGQFLLTTRGRRWAARFALNLPEKSSRRSLAPVCLDWSERRDHVGGALGAALANRLLKLKWIKRRIGSREVVITPRGQRELVREFGIVLNKDE